MSVLEVKDLYVYFDTRRGQVKAVDGVSLKVGNEIIGIAGESGCGKTTLALSIMKLIRPPGKILGGRILFKGVDLLTLDNDSFAEIRGKEIAYIPQGSMNSLNPVIRVWEHFYHVFKDHGLNLSKREVIEKAGALVTKLGLSERVLKMYPHELSGGMKQRVVISLAMALNPSLLIADEPTTALDVVNQRMVLDTLVELRKQFNTTIILITHDMAVHAEVTDRIAIMYAGKIVEVGDTYSIFREPLHPYTRMLIESIPVIGAEKKLKGISGQPPDLVQPPEGCRFHPRCPYAIKGLCDKVQPELIPVGERLVACHLYAKG